jgi:hypothetical protein
MMVQVPSNRWAGVVVYFLAITGIGLVVTKLSSIVANQAIVLALPHLDNSPPKLSLIQQRRIDATLAIPPLAQRERTWVAALDASPVAPALIAARLDRAEKEDLVAAPAVATESEGVFRADSQPSSIATRATKHQIARSNSRYAAVTTRDIFNQSFGVITVAAN